MGTDFRDQTEINGGEVVSTFKPVSASRKELEARRRSFEERFRATMLGEGSSLLAPNVYHDTQRNRIEAFRNLPEDYHSLNVILGGLKHSWQEVNATKPQHDQRIIDTALDKGLLDMIGANRLYFISYGLGPNGTALSKDGCIIERAIRQGIQVDGFTGIDLNRTFAGECSHLIGDAFDIEATGVVSDFVWGPVHGLPNINVHSDAVKIVTVFGNTAFNAPSFQKDGKHFSYSDSVENFFARMNVQNGLGHFLILTIYTDQNTQIKENKYSVKYTKKKKIIKKIS